MPVHAIDPSTPVRCAIFAATAVRVCYLLSHCFEMMFVWSDRLHQVRHDCHCQGLAVLRVQQRRCKLTNKSQQRLVLLSASSFLFFVVSSSLFFSSFFPRRSSSFTLPFFFHWCSAFLCCCGGCCHLVCSFSVCPCSHALLFLGLLSLSLSLSPHTSTRALCARRLALMTRTSSDAASRTVGTTTIGSACLGPTPRLVRAPAP